jgi:hypothetical protein
MENVNQTRMEKGLVGQELYISVNQEAAGLI